MAKKSSSPNDEIQELLDNIEENESELVSAEIQPLKIAEAVPEPMHDPQTIIIALEGGTGGASGADNAVGGGGSSDAGDLVARILSDYGDRTGEIWKQLMEDRELLTKYIEIFNDRIQDPDKAKNVNIEALMTLLSAKTSASINATRMLDSTAKMIVAIKNMKTDGVTSTSLDDLLNDGVGDTEEFDPNQP